jgi:flagellin
MPLSIINNVASLTAQNNLSRSNTSLAKSLERLSSGLKINRGADGPAGLVISEQQRAQITGLQTAVENTSKAVNVVQTAEGALNEINRLLGKVRGLALDSANIGVNDTNALAANQAEITNALQTIDRIANTTKFGTKNLLNGQAAVDVTISGANNAGLGALHAGTNAAAGAHTVAITTQGTGGNVTGPAGAGSLAAAGSVVLSGGGLSSNVTVALAVGDNVASTAVKIQSALDNAAAQGGGSGKFVVDVVGGNQIRIRSNILGSGAITATSDSAATAAVVGFSNAGTTGSAGAALVVTVDGQATTVSAGSQGLNNLVTFAGSEGISFNVAVSAGQTAASGAGSNTTINVTDNGLVFQIGSNANETAKVSIDKASTDVLGTGLSGLLTGVSNLSQINVTTFNGSQDAIKVVDQAINQITTLRGKLGAFQQNTLESTANNLRATLENTVAAESTIRDTDFAAETATFTKNQVLLQAGTSVLQNANQTAQLVLGLLRS